MRKIIIKGALLGLTAGIIATFFDSFYMLSRDTYVPAEYPLFLLFANVAFWVFFGCLIGAGVCFFLLKKHSCIGNEEPNWLVWFFIPFVLLYGFLGKFGNKEVFSNGFDNNLVFLLAAVFICCVIILKKKYSRFGFGNGLLIPELVVIAALFHFCSNFSKNAAVIKSFGFFSPVNFFSDPLGSIELFNYYCIYLYGAGVVLIFGIYFITVIKGGSLHTKPFRMVSVIFLITVCLLVSCFWINRTVFLKQYRQFVGMQPFEPKEQLPPVILIVLDTLRKRSFDEHPDIYKNLTAFSHDSLVFEGCIANSSWTLPSHASLFTGLALQEHGADQMIDGPLWFGGQPPIRSLGKEFTTLAEIFRASGYHTAAITSNYGVMNPSNGMAQGFQMYDWSKSIGFVYEGFAFRPLLHFFSFVTNIKNKFALPYRKAEDVNDAIDHFLARVPSGPFFLFANYMDSHDPYLPSQPFKGSFLNASSLYGYPIFKRAGLFLNCISEAYHCTLNELFYKGDIAYLDYQIGVLLDRLKEAGLYDEALIVITSDHGELFCENGYSAHRQPLYEGVTRVPLFVKFPQQRVTGTETHYMTIADLYPTILSICGLSFPNTISAKPFGKPAGPVVAEFYHQVIGVNRAMYDGRYKYMKFERAKENALYDLVADPLEQNNIAGVEPTVVAQMETKLADWLMEHPPLYGEGMTPEREPLPFRHLDDLKTLGYIQ